jgi:hypothetical protein
MAATFFLCNRQAIRQLLACLSMWLLAVGLSAASLYAQGVGGAIQGTVRDPTGAVVPGATITTISTETNLQRTVTSNGAGLFSVPDLPPGRYRVQVSGQGFQTKVMENIELVVGQQLVLNTALQVGEITQQVTVTGEAPLVDTSTSQVAGLVAERQVKDLPLNGRSFDNLISLNPAMVNSTGIKQTTSSSTGPGNYFSIGGRRPGENIFLWNGVEYPGGSNAISSTPGGVSGQLLGIEAVREFNVVPNLDAAEYGHRAGGQVGIVTQSGTNGFHGSLYEFLRNSALDARDFFDRKVSPNDPRIPPFRRNQFGGSAGGPIKRDKTFIFGNYEGFRQAWSLTKVSIVPDEQARLGRLPDAKGVYQPVQGLNPAVLPYFALWPEPNGPNLGQGKAKSYNTTPNPVREDFGIVRVDHNFSQQDTFNAAYTIDDGDSLGTGQNPFSLVSNLERAQVLSLGEVHVFSPNIVNNFSAGFSRVWFRYFYSVSISPPGVEPFVAGKPPGQINIGGSQGSTDITPAGSGPNTGHDQLNIDNMFTYQDQVRITKGIHSIAFGAWFERLQSNDLSGTYGQTNFTDLTGFLQGKPSLFQVTQPAPAIPFRVWMAAWFVQDAMKLTSNLTLNLGLRHEFSDGYHANNNMAASFTQGPNGVLLTQPRIGDSLFTTNRATRLFGPRAAVAWDPFGKGQTSVRAGFGIAYNLLDNVGWCCINVPPLAGASQISGVGKVPFPLQIVPGVTKLASATPGGGRLGIQGDPSTPTVLSYHFEIEQALPSNTSIRVAYLGSRGYHEVLRADANTVIPTICPASPCPASLPAGTKYFPSTIVRRNPQLGSAGIFFTSGVNNYNGFFVDVNHRFRRGLGLRTNFSHGRSLDNESAITGTQAGGQIGVVMDPDDRRRDYGLAAFDIRNRFSLNGMYELPLGAGRQFLGGVKGVADKLVSGWQLNTIVNLQSGFPFTPILGFNQSRDGDTGNPDRPDMAPGRTLQGIYLRTPEHWVDATAFTLPAAGTFGNAGRNILIGPGLADLDLSMFKTTRLTERSSLQFRAEAFNLLNHTNLGLPNLVMLTSSGAPSSTAGNITTHATNSRQIQLGLKLSW